MIEDSSMEKKNQSSRSAPGPSKSSGADAKAKQDVAANKYVRSGRRRESPCPRPDGARKQFAQKGRGFDKRPRPRGLYSNDRDRSDIVDVPKAEIGSALHQGSKKLNLNHLLNFTYTPRVANSHTSYWGNSWKNRNKWWTTKKHKYNKEQFLQANCQFVVRAGGDYSVHAVDPDPLVDWDSIELVRIPGHEVASCPICLYEPVAAKITRCGHIFCWACILHYLALTDKSWRKCPICYEAVHKKDLKSVTSLSTHSFVVGETISMHLMQRVKGSVFAMVKSRCKVPTGKFLNLGEQANQNLCFSKLLLATPEQVRDLIISKERQELERALKEEKDCPEACFIESALELVMEREKQLFKKEVLSINDSEHLTLDNEIYATQPVPELLEGKKTIIYASAFCDQIVEQNNNTTDIDERNETQHSFTLSETPQDFCGNISPLPHSLRNRRQRNESMSTDSMNDDVATDNLDMGNLSLDENGEDKNSKDAYYFYQASDGQHIYMHALNIRMLIKQYGSLDKCPEVITAKIVEKEGVSMTEDLRKRLRYLCHLPLTCEFEIAELNLRPPVVLQEVLTTFREELEKRKRRRGKRAQEEQKRERYIREEENRKWGKFPGAHLNLQSPHQFPRYDLYDGSEMGYFDQTIADSAPIAGLPEITSSPATSLPSSDPSISLGSSLEENAHSTPSFAQMLREGKAKCDILPRSAAGTSHPLEHGKRDKTGKESESDPEDYVPVPEYHLSFGNAIQEALVKASGTNFDFTDESNGGRKKKKKKIKSTLLFTTSMARHQ